MSLSIRYSIFDKQNLPSELEVLLKATYQWKERVAASIESFIKPIRNDAQFIVEYPYVDKVYRDSYYHYFSTKLNSYPRDCFRISIFELDMKLSDFYRHQKHEQIEKKYRGYFVIRPTIRSLFGRTAIDKKILKQNDFLTCTAKLPASCNGQKLTATGFPYASQDSETISCAETSLWSLMEYFGNKYPEYTPVLPSEIIDTLKPVSFERQVQSKGLTYLDLSYALKEFGFGTRVYVKEHFGDDFESLLACYIESGIPVIVATSNKEGINHAYICSGRECMKSQHFKKMDNKNGIVDFDSIQKKFVFIDDNHFPYQQATLQKPCAYYSTDDWKKSQIRYFIIPLHPKIYLEASEAKAYCHKFISKIAGLENLITRVFLKSSRSYKDEIIKRNDITNELKKNIISIPMPKFIWLCELSDTDLLREGKVNGTLVLDATEPNLTNLKPFIYFHIQDLILKKEKGILASEELTNAVNSYSVYKSNLQGF